MTPNQNNQLKSAIKPAYIIVAKDGSSKTKFSYYLAESKDIIEAGSFLEFRGKLLDNKTQADELNEKPCATKDAPGISVNRKIPWHNIERLDNITYSKEKV